MFDDLLIHDMTKAQLQAFVSLPAHGLLITGPAGSGKKQLAGHLAAGLLKVEPGKLDLYPHFFPISKPADKTEIPIESARHLIGKLSLKVPDSDLAINRVAIIFDADLLSAEAQNALLKVLEEPPAGSLLILTSSRPQTILPTVISRLQTISVRPAPLAQSRRFFSSYNSEEVDSAWRLSRGAPSLLTTLLEQGSNHQMKQAVEDAKKILTFNKYDRLGFIQSVAKNKLQFELLLEALSRVLSALQQANISNPSLSHKVLESRQAVLKTQESLAKNTNARLLATDLALRMPL